MKVAADNKKRVQIYLGDECAEEEWKRFKILMIKRGESASQLFRKLMREELQKEDVA